MIETIRFPEHHKNVYMKKSVTGLRWQCDHCAEWKNLGGRWAHLAGKFICEDCICSLFDEGIDTKYIPIE